MKILIVDDDPGNRTILEAYLRDRAEVIHSAANGHEAVQAFTSALDEKAPYSLVCMDIMMPGMDGQEALQSIRRIERERGVPPGMEVKALMISCLGDQKNVCQAFFHGQATSYLTKPVTRDALHKALEEIRF